MLVEIGALVQKDDVHALLENLAGKESVKIAIVASGRSNDLFDEKDYGEFGEASIVTVLADETDSDLIMEHLADLTGVSNSKKGMVFRGNPVIKSSLD